MPPNVGGPFAIVGSIDAGVAHGGEAYYTGSGPSTKAVNGWRYVVGVFDSTRYRVYVDGVYHSISQATHPDLKLPDRRFYVGPRITPGIASGGLCEIASVYSSKGSISLLSFYDRGLTKAEIASHLQAAYGATKPVPPMLPLGRGAVLAEGSKAVRLGFHPSGLPQPVLDPRNGSVLSDSVAVTGNGAVTYGEQYSLAANGVLVKGGIFGLDARFVEPDRAGIRQMVSGSPFYVCGEVDGQSEGLPCWDDSVLLLDSVGHVYGRGRASTAGNDPNFSRVLLPPASFVAIVPWGGGGGGAVVDGRLWMWGNATRSQRMGVTVDPFPGYWPHQVQLPDAGPIRSVAFGHNRNRYPTGTDVGAQVDTNFVVAVDGRVWGWGYREGGPDPFVPATPLTAVLFPADVIVEQVEMRQDLAFALDTAGNVWVWGRMANGTIQLVPQQIPGLSGVKQISATEVATYALLTDGTAQSWGSDANQALGNGPVVASNETPSTVLNETGTAPLAGVRSLGHGHDAMFALVGETPEPLALDVTLKRDDTEEAPPTYDVTLSTVSPGSYFKFSLPSGMSTAGVAPKSSAVVARGGSGASWSFTLDNPPLSVKFSVQRSDATGVVTSAAVAEVTVPVNSCPGYNYSKTATGTVSVCGESTYGIDLVSVPNGVFLAGPKAGQKAKMMPKGGLVIDSAVGFTPQEIKRLVDPTPRPGDPTGPPGPSDISGVGLYIGGRKVAEASLPLLNTHRRLGDRLPNGTLFTLAPVIGDETYLADIQNEIKDIKRTVPETMSLVPIWVDKGSPCHGSKKRPPVAPLQKNARDAFDQLIPSWYPYPTQQNPVVVGKPYSQLNATDKRKLLDLAYEDGVDSARRAAYVAKEKFGFPKDSMIYIDIEDPNVDLSVATVTSLSKAVDGFPALPSVSVPPMKAEADCGPPIGAFLYGFIGGMSGYGYRSGLYTGNKFYSTMQKVDTARALVLNDGAGVPGSKKAERRFPAGLWIAGARGTTVTKDVAFSGSPRLFKHYDTTFNSFNVIFDIEDDLLPFSYRNFSGNQFVFDGIGPRIPRKPFDLNCFSISDSATTSPKSIVRRFANDRQSPETSLYVAGTCRATQSPYDPTRVGE